MIRGYYAAGSGMLTQSRMLDISGNNISNSRTAGFKSERAVTEAFGDHLVERNIGQISMGQTINAVSTDFTQGASEDTGSPFDLAIEGEGFFTMGQPDGSMLYTRNGRFSLDSAGFITDANGGRLMGEKGAINTGGADFTVSSNGDVYVNGKLSDRLAIHNPADKTGMTKTASGLFADAGGAGRPFTGRIKQGAYEISNADMMGEMMAMMSSQRSFQACSQAVKMIDSTISKAVELGRLS